MKTQFFSFAGGLFTGLLLLSMSSAPIGTPSASTVSYTSSPDNPPTNFNLVPIQEFRDDISRYNTTYAKFMGSKMPPLSWQSPTDEQQFRHRHPDMMSQPAYQHFMAQPRKASRMFLYSVKTLEDFLGAIKELGAQSHLDPQKLAIRFYYGVYPKGKIIAGENYGSLHTLFMVPNYWSSSRNQFMDISMKHLMTGWDNLDNAKRAALIADSEAYENFVETYFVKNVMQWDPNGSILLLDASSADYSGTYPVQVASLLPWFSFDAVPSDPPVINQGQLCPPNCPSQSLLDTRTVNW